jgi:hypothetical protein
MTPALAFLLMLRLKECDVVAVIPIGAGPSKPYVKGYWPVTRARYARSFQVFADGLMASVSPTPPETSPP